MMFLRWLDINILEGDSIDEYAKLTKDYHSYLDSIRPYVTQSVYDYTIADWHYDATIHYSPHNAIFKNITIIDNGKSGLTLNMSLLGAYHDYKLGFSYENVMSYSIDAIPNLKEKYDSSQSIHGTFLWDSIEYDKQSKLTKHHIVFCSNTKVIIACEKFTFSFIKIK